MVGVLDCSRRAQAGGQRVRSEGKDVAALRLIEGRLVRLLDEDASPGFHGVG